MRSWSATRNVWLSMNSPQKSQKILLPVARLYVTAGAVHKLTTLGGCSGVISQAMVTLFCPNGLIGGFEFGPLPQTCFGFPAKRTGRELQSRLSRHKEFA